MAVAVSALQIYRSRLRGVLSIDMANHSVRFEPESSEQGAPRPWECLLNKIFLHVFCEDFGLTHFTHGKSVFTLDLPAEDVDAWFAQMN